MSTEAPDLTGAVAVVTGASRGVGRGVACALGDAGATVYVTGRSSRAGQRTEDLPGTVEDTAEEVDRRGGHGIPRVCDHDSDSDTVALFEQVRAEQGRLDVLVNNAWRGYERALDSRFDGVFWEQPLWRWDLFAGSLRGYLSASRAAVPLMMEHGRGLVVTLSFTDGDQYLGQVAYDVVKNASDRMAFAMAQDLRKRGIASVGLHPGLVRTERVDAAWERLGDGPAAEAHSSEYVGRAIAHLAADPDVMERTGQKLAVGTLAEEYGFTDLDGRAPGAFRLVGRRSLANRMERLNRVVAG